MVNVGSVGQPRDGDWRACYVIADDDRIEFHRVEYNLRSPEDDGPRRRAAAVALPRKFARGFGSSGPMR